MLTRLLLAPLVALALLRPLPAPAWEIDGTEVDVELVLAVDVSLSVTPREIEIQRRGYAEAITSPDVMEAVRAGLLGRIAISYMEWAGSGSQRSVIGWTLIETEQDAHAFAQKLLSAPGGTLRRTSISEALAYAAATFDDNGFEGLRKVIDISGDGPNNSGGPVVQARDAALARGITINGLPLMTQEGYGGRWDLEDLDLYYNDCVIGGPGSFVIPVVSWSAFADAVRRKLVMEIADLGPRHGRDRGRDHAARPRPGYDWESEAAQVTRASNPARARYDCLVGEKIWERSLRRYQGTP